MAKDTKKDEEDHGKKPVNPQNPHDLPKHGDGSGDTGKNPTPAAPAGSLEGPDADKRRREDQIDDAKRREAGKSATLEADTRRKAAIDALEAEIKRHEAAFEDYAGGLLTTKPVMVPQTMTPMQLHDLRLEAIKRINTPGMPVGGLEEIRKRMHEIEFVPNHGTDGGS